MTPLTNNTQRFIQFKQEKMDPISSSFCGAKWFEGTIWLYQGATASCHHNPFHKIELDPENPHSLHNTPQKQRERQAMLQGEKPNGCNYCWAVEADGGISDRYVKTQAVPTQLLEDWTKTQPLNANPYMIEIAFDRTCNLACAYCGPSFSSKWANDIKQNGPYNGLSTDSRYSTDSSGDVIHDDEINPYTEAFFRWLPELEETLRWIRVTGGEPTMSPNFWRFLDRLAEGKFKGNLSINTNLICKEEILDRLLKKIQLRFRTTLHTSIESSFEHTEYVRDGFDKSIWLKNIYKILDSPVYVVHKLNFTTSINNLGVWSMIDYLHMISDLKKKYGKDRVELSCNFVHYPVFMRVQLIPMDLRMNLVSDYVQWLDNNRHLCHHGEIAHVERLIAVMSEVDSHWENYINKNTALNDLKLFVEQFDQRRNKNFRTVLDKRFVGWYDSI